MKQGPGTIESESQKDEVTAQSIQSQIIKLYGTGLIDMDHDARQQTQTACRMNQQVSVSRTQCGFCATGPDQKNGAYGQHFPENEKAEEITGKNRPQSASRVKEPCHHLKIVFHMEGVKDGDKTDEVKNISEQQAEFVHPSQNQVVVQEINPEMGALPQIHQIQEADHGD